MSDIESNVKKSRNDYYKIYRKNNKSKIKQHQQNYWIRRAIKNGLISDEKPDGDKENLT
jgi:hypothetical protein